MNILRNASCLDKLHELILKKKTGSPKQLAERLGISRASLYAMIDELNALNMSVAYSSKYETFYYESALKPKVSTEFEAVKPVSKLRKTKGRDLKK